MPLHTAASDSSFCPSARSWVLPFTSHCARCWTHNTQTHRHTHATILTSLILRQGRQTSETYYCDEQNHTGVVWECGMGHMADHGQALENLIFVNLSWGWRRGVSKEHSGGIHFIRKELNEVKWGRLVILVFTGNSEECSKGSMRSPMFLWRN